LIDYALWLVGRRKRENGRMRMIESDDEDDDEDEKKEDEEEKQGAEDGSVFA
jgi:hypothetical protein